MLRKSVFASVLFAICLLSSPSLATTCSSYAYTLSNGTTADASQVMSNFNTIMTCANSSLAPLASPSFSGNLAVGAASTAGVKGYFVEGATILSGADTGIYSNISNTPASASTATITGLQAVPAWTGSASSPGGTLTGLYLQPTLGSSASIGTVFGAETLLVHNGTGTISAAYGQWTSVDSQGAGTIANGYAGYFVNQTNTTGSHITNSYGVYVASASAGAGSGSITNNYGLYLENQVTTGATNYTLYSAGGTNYFGGNVGIGTTSPTVKLYVNSGDSTYGEVFIGQLAITTNRNNLAQLSLADSGAGGHTWTLGSTTGAGHLDFRDTTASGGPIRLSIDGSGNVGIGTTSPGQALDVVGTIRQSNCTTAGTLSANTSGDIICTSDGRLKNILADYRGGLDAISRITPKLFTYKPTSADPVETFVHAGFIAQDVMAVIPQASARQRDGYYSLDTTAILAAAVNSIKELKAANDRQSAEIADLRTRLDQADRRLAALGARLGVRTAANDNTLRVSPARSGRR